MKTHLDKRKSGVKPNDQRETKELKMDGPVSEKDEVKQAEERTRKALKNHL